MTEDREKNGEETDQETTPTRDEKGKFVSGTPGGPGRGNEKPYKPVQYEDIERSLAKDLRSKDPRDRARAGRVLKDLIDRRGPTGGQHLIPPVIQAHLDLRKQALAHGGWEMIALWIMQHCADCPKFPGRDSFPFDDAPGPDGD